MNRYNLGCEIDCTEGTGNRTDGSNGGKGKVTCALSKDSCFQLVRNSRVLRRNCIDIFVAS